MEKIQGKGTVMRAKRAKKNQVFYRGTGTGMEKIQGTGTVMRAKRAKKFQVF